MGTPNIGPTPVGDEVPRFNQIGAGPLWKTLEVDFGDVPVSTRKFTIVDAGVVDSTARVTVVASGATATGRAGNDWEVDAANFSTLAGVGEFILSVVSLNGRIRGVRRLSYTIGGS